MKITIFDPKELYLIQILNKESINTSGLAYLRYFFSIPLTLGIKLFKSISQYNFPDYVGFSQLYVDIDCREINLTYSSCLITKFKPYI